jgi:DNA repair protein RecO (recombination protein O)
VIEPAFLIGAVAYGEADRIVTLYTRGQGKVSALARGARKSRRRFGAALSLFVVGEAHLSDRRGGDLFLLERFDVDRDFTRLGEDIVKMAHASYATELLRELTVPRHPDAALFDLTVAMYQALLAGPTRADRLRAFELRLLDEIGLRPALDRCVACGSDALGADAKVDAHRGGALCSSCGLRAIGPALAPAVAARLAGLQRGELPAADGDVEATRAVVHAFVLSHLRAPLRSLEFIHKLRHA